MTSARLRGLRRGAWTVLALLLLGLLGCGKGGPTEAPPQNGKPAEPSPEPKPESKPEAAPQSVSPSQLEKDRAADEAPAAAPFAPPPRASPKREEQRPAAPSKAAPGVRSRRDLVEPGLTPQLLRRRLDDVVKQSTPDCPSARERKQAICDLASQICQLVDQDPEVASVESYCDDAKQRCSEAERRTAQRCN